jgi:hypothetical protein
MRRRPMEFVDSRFTRTPNAIFLIPGFGTMDDLQQAYDLGVTVARVACHCTESDITEQQFGGYIKPIKRAAREYGCDPRKLALRLGERQVVATQEDVVIEEARRLVGKA